MRAQSLKTYCLSGFIVCVISSKFENLCARITFAISFLSYFTIGSWSISPLVSSGKVVNEMTVLVSLSITACLNTFQNFKKLSVDLSVVTCLVVVLEIVLVFFVASDLLVLAELWTVLLLQENVATDNPKNTVEMWRNCFMNVKIQKSRFDILLSDAFFKLPHHQLLHPFSIAIPKIYWMCFARSSLILKKTNFNAKST